MSRVIFVLERLNVPKLAEKYFVEMFILAGMRISRRETLSKKRVCPYKSTISSSKVMSKGIAFAIVKLRFC